MATSMDVGGRTCLSGTAIPLVVNDGECRCLNVVSSAILAGCPSVARVSGDEGSQRVLLSDDISTEGGSLHFGNKIPTTRVRSVLLNGDNTAWSLLVRETPQRVPE